MKGCSFGIQDEKKSENRSNIGHLKLLKVLNRKLWLYICYVSVSLMRVCMFTLFMMRRDNIGERCDLYPWEAVKPKLWQIKFMRVSILNKRPELLAAHFLFWRWCVNQCAAATLSVNTDHSKTTWNQRALNSNQTMTSARIRFYCAFCLSVKHCRMCYH